ncbi:hypothetical protein GBK04_02460 [Cytophagaceae bacterium SJW1-29]|uniref:DUF5723 domain-containing protein n=2 Tax=Salmonirosea aquatica TaxID=2654236 RepID=A0A7C9BF87_9BACT|nr:hypothetical protein [Cytophagaceae bacterium SJW1-29]
MLDLLRQKNSRPLDPYDLEEIRNGKPKNGTLSGELRGPAVSFRLGNRTNLGIMTRVRSGFQVTDASERLMAITRLGLANQSNLQDLGYLALFASQSENRFNLTSQAYSEWAFSLGQVLIETDAFRVKGGFTLKRYFGYAGGYVQNRSLNYRLLPDSTTTNAAYMQIDRFDATMGYTDADRASFLSPGWLFGRNASGRGWGWDVGLAYETLAEEGTLPTLRLSASLTDAGQIHYAGQGVKNYHIQADDRQITEEEWRGYSSPQEGENQLNAFGRLFEEEFGLKDDDNTGEFTLATPTALNLSADVQVVNHFYINATVIQSIKRTSVPQLRQTSLWAVVPRYESEKVGLSFPIIRQNGGWAVGTGLRVGGLVVGSDNLLGLFSRNGRFKAQGVDIYGGVSFGLNPRKN